MSELWRWFCISLSFQRSKYEIQNKLHFLKKRLTKEMTSAPQLSIIILFISFEYFLNVFTEFLEIKLYFKKFIQTCVKRARCYHSGCKIQVTERICKLIPPHASVIYQILWNHWISDLCRKNSLAKKYQDKTRVIRYRIIFIEINWRSFYNISLMIFNILEEKWWKRWLLKLMTSSECHNWWHHTSLK